jgi:predicted ATPase
MNTRFESIHIRGFRRLADVRLKLQPLNVIIGANGGGKTSLLDVFSLLAASASGKLKQTLSEYGGVDSCLTNLACLPEGKAKSLAFELQMTVPNDAPLDYWLVIGSQGIAYEVIEEMLTQQRNPNPPPFKHIQAYRNDIRYFDCKSTEPGLVRPTWEYDVTESALSQVPNMFQHPEDFRKRLASSTHYHELDVGPRAPVRVPQPMREARLPGKSGEDLVSCLYTLRETDPDRFELIEATLKTAFPDFERLNFPPVAAGTLALTWKNRTSRTPFYMHQLSEGTLRFLWLVTLLHSPGLTAVTILDEPEVSLHPELLSLLADLLREASERTQLIVATHADRLVRFLKPAEIVAVDVGEEGAAEFTRADELDLEQWLEDYTLDEVWRMGRMGGRA